MSSPFTRGTLYLKRRNQDLLAQLESNSAILQDRLEILSKALTKSTPDRLHSSPPGRKRGYESWLVRNHSGQVSASLNPNTFWGSTLSPVDDVPLTSWHVDETTPMTPTKRAKKCGDQCPHGNRPTAGPTTVGKKSTSKSRKAQCPDCYCQSAKQPPVPKEHGKKTAGRVCVGCTKYKIPDNSAASLGGSQRRTLDEARSLLSYSPQSKFLKRLKERSKVNLDEPESSSPEVRREGGRERRRQLAKKPGDVGSASGQSATKGRGFDASNTSRPTVKTSSNLTDHSLRRDVTENTKLRDQPARDIPQPVANPYKPTAAPTRNLPVPKTYKTMYDLPRSPKESTRPPSPSTRSPSKHPPPSTRSSSKPPPLSIRSSPKHPARSPDRKICRPALARLQPTLGNNTPTPPRATNNKPPPTRPIHINPSPTEKNPRSRSKPSKHVVALRKDQTKTHGQSKSTKAKSRATSSRATSSKRTSPTASSSTSPNSSPTRGDPKPNKRREQVKTRDNCVKVKTRESHVKSPSVRPKRSKNKILHDVPSCYHDLKTTPGKKYGNVYKPYCKKYRRRESCSTPTEAIENECYRDEGSPTVECCKPYRRSHRTAANSCCSHCCCAAATRTRRPCDCENQQPDDWVDAIGRYRQSHWFDCHSYPDLRTRPKEECPRGHRDGVHRLILNDRLFPTPLPCTISCGQCHQAGDTSAQQTFPREITLNTARNREAVPVVLPRARRAEEPSADTFRVYHERKATGGRKPNGCMLTHPIYSKPLPKFPAPANSLALRYQKGIV